MFGARRGFLLFVTLSILFAIKTNAWADKPNPICGDGKCQKGETESCPEDCSPASTCGNGICSADETYESCPNDCDPPPPSICNSDGTCNEGEDCISCPADCAGVTTGKPSGRYCCGFDSFCDEGLCGADCGTPISTSAYCGDGTLNISAGEECDDGGESSFCDADCTFRVCGDGTLNTTAGEECDDDGESSSCDADCTYSICGDGTHNQASGEECDDGNTDPGDGCDDVCMIEIPPEPHCGDGNTDPGEECDDGNMIPGDGCDANCIIEPSTAQVPSYQFNIGDSIGEGEAANGTIGSINHETVWSTGYDANDSVNSLNERFEYTNATEYYENNSSRDAIFNHAVSGATMADFAVQANDIVAAVSSSGLSYNGGMITILLGNNDVCASSLDTMTDPALFEEQYKAGLNVLAQSPETRDANIHVSSIPDIYWLWNAKLSNWWCRLFVWPNVPCENLLASPADDCVSTASRLDPDYIYPGDGSNCIRRKEFHARIRDIYNPILRDVLQEYKDNGSLPNAYFVDIFDVQFDSSHVNGGDCFHPSEAGHGLLSEREWCVSQWGVDDFTCAP
jgi:cysteine-rich repeat protein